MNFLEKLDVLMAGRGLNKNTLSAASGIPYTTIDGWYKKGFEGLKLSTLQKLSEYFDVPLDYWVSKDRQKEKSPDPEESKANIHNRAERYYDLLIAGGYISEGESLTKEQTEAVKAVITLMDLFFSSGGK